MNRLSLISGLTLGMLIIALGIDGHLREQAAARRHHAARVQAAQAEQTQREVAAYKAWSEAQTEAMHQRMRDVDSNLRHELLMQSLRAGIPAEEAMRKIMLREEWDRRR